MKGGASWLTAPFGFEIAIRNFVFRPDRTAQMNAILSEASYHRSGDGNAMAVQRKVFRIEEHARPRAAAGVAVGEAAGASQHQEFMAELQALREMIGPRQPVDRD